ncbi:MAG: hypothetical protein E7571_06945 [Ruminococcaceae bacterium]|nr:hypothetical protein [Oscillospiraceae bacterium]
MYIDNLVEMHCHIIPGIDDGSQDIETSLRMIERLKEQGAKKIVLTPHYYSDTISLDDFLRRRDRAFNALMNELPSGYPTLYPAAEVYISPYLFNNDNIDDLRIANSNYVLIEHPFSSPFGEGEYDRLMNLYCDYGVRPVLAHIERYRALMEDKYKLDDLIEMGCLPQVNISTFADAPRGIRKKLFKYLETGRVLLIGSDAHNLTSRPPEYEDGINAIIKKCGKEAVDVLMSNANLLVK